MDVHIPRAITVGLRSLGVDVLTAQEDAAALLSDAELLDRVTSLRRILFTFDNDFLVDASRRQRQSIPFTGVIYVHPLRVSVSKRIIDLELIAKVGEPADLANRVEYLPL